MKNMIPLLLILILSTQLAAQQRKDLIWEYKKLQTNDRQLKISLNGNLDDYTDDQIKAILDSAWIKKRCIILMQTLGFLDIYPCTTRYFSEEEIKSAAHDYKKSISDSSDIHRDTDLLRELFNTYITSTNTDHLSGQILHRQLVYDKLDILLIAYKYELILQLWVKPHNAPSEYVHIKSFDITDPNVSILGPKSRYGDQLTPEGIYQLEFYPSLRWSDFYLAFRINYPNQHDLTRRQYWQIKEKSGGDINIHGSCVSIGCIPIGNPDIIELFLLIRENQKQGNSVNMHIYPLMFDQDYAATVIKSSTKNKTQLGDFWQSLRKVYNHISRYQKIPQIFINKTSGYYQLDGV